MNEYVYFNLLIYVFSKRPKLLTEFKELFLNSKLGQLKVKHQILFIVQYVLFLRKAQNGWLSITETNLVQNQGICYYRH